MGFVKAEKSVNFGCFLQCSRELGPFFRKTVCTIELDAKRRFRRGTGRRGWKKLKNFIFFLFRENFNNFFQCLNEGWQDLHQAFRCPGVTLKIP